MNELFLKREDFEKLFEKNIKIETYSKSIDSLFSKRMQDKINYAPYYQRNYVWDANKATYFIESILLGTEIPPLIFFKSRGNIEIIDGRQRFETIKRFLNNEIKLTQKGLKALKQLSRKTYSNLAYEELEVRDLFDDAKIRIIEFGISADPPVSSEVEDKFKKEIFGRYNSGITPLKKSEIDNAKYDEDNLSTFIKNKLKNKSVFKLFEILTKRRFDQTYKVTIDRVMTIIRKNCALSIYPIQNYSKGHSRTEMIEKAYEFYSSNIDLKAGVEKEYDRVIRRIKYVNKIKDYMDQNDLPYNWLMFETIYWALSICEIESENIEFYSEEITLKKVSNALAQKTEKFSTQDYHYQEQTISRYEGAAEVVKEVLGLDMSIYLYGGGKRTEVVKNLKVYTDAKVKLNELETLRITKPEPSRNSIDDISRMMGKKRFLIRPSYQRSEVISLSKASSIIESILLDIPIPAIFIYKRENGISEVVDGQQRLLTILGYIGSEYKNQDDKSVTTKNHKFSLRGLKILDLNRKKYADLNEGQKEKILDFELFLVEIEEKLNPNFDPIDLFIRLNDKPYPIRQNSFEMWNSWVSQDIVLPIKLNTKKHIDWFYVRKIKGAGKDRDRMINEDLYTSLAYLEHQSKEQSGAELDIYQKGDRINARVADKSAITHFLEECSKNEVLSGNFLASIVKIETFIEKFKLLLSESNDLKILNSELESLLKNENTKYYRRNFQDFYILWFALKDISEDVIQQFRSSIKDDTRNIFRYMKEVDYKIQKDKSLEEFLSLVDKMKLQYKK